MGSKFNSIYTDLDAMGWYMVHNSRPYIPAWKKRILKLRPYLRTLALIAGLVALFYGMKLA